MLSSPRAYSFLPEKSSLLTFSLLFLLSLFLFVILSSPVLAGSLKQPRTISPKGKKEEAHPTFVWKAVDTATSYSLWIKSVGEDEPLFDQRLSAAEVGCATGHRCSFQPEISLTPEKQVNWKVRAFNSTEQSRWSSKRDYTLKALKAPRTKSPGTKMPGTKKSRNTINVSEPTYIWRSVKGAVSYELMVQQGKNEPFLGMVSAVDAGCALSRGDCNYKPALALKNANYKWRIRAISAQGAVGKWSDFRWFRVRDVVVIENQAPVADDQSVNVDEDGNVAITLTATDADGDTLTYTFTQPTNGSLTGTAPDLTYTPTADFNGEDSFTFIANDGELESAEAMVSVKVNPVPEQPQNVTATAGNAQVLLEWDEVPDADSYAVCLAEASIVDAVSCTTGIPLGTLVNSLLIDDTMFNGGLENGTEYFFVVLAVADVNGSPVYSTASAQVTATPQGIIEPTPTGRLNDTGITQCGDYAFGDGSRNHDNNVDCQDTVDADGDPIPEGQDALSGRDVTDNDSTNGHAGFNFTKIGANGAALLASASEWSCVKDNVTGLIWEVKTENGGLYDKDDQFTWYSTDNTNNGGSVGFAKASDNDVNSDDATCSGYDASDAVGTTWCNTSAFVDRVNTVGLCGGNNWRLPTREELRSIVSYDRSNPAMDSDYFPTMVNSSYWSSSTYAANGNFASVIGSFSGYARAQNKNSLQHVRLVRGE